MPNATNRVYIKQVNQTLNNQWFHLLAVTSSGVFIIGSPTQRLADKVSERLKTVNPDDMTFKRSLMRCGLWSMSVECHNGNLVCVNHWMSPLTVSIPFDNKRWQECQLLW